MNIKEAMTAIEAILAEIPDHALPEFDRIEFSESGLPTVWYGGMGRCLGSAKSGDGRDPLVYRRSASQEAIQLEMTYRADKALLDNGDDPTGVNFAVKGSRN